MTYILTTYSSLDPCDITFVPAYLIAIRARSNFTIKQK